jgi:branched-chain amino acid transport system permease protein
VDYWLHVVNIILLFAMLGASLNLLLGYTGLVSMSHAAFFGVGAYAAALTAVHFGWPFPLTLLAAVAITTVLAGGVTVPALRVRGEYLILLTLALQMVLYELMLSWVDLTNGRTGISAIPRPALFGHQLVTPAQFLPLIAVCAAVVFAVAHRVGESPFGRVLKAIRDDERAAQAIGKNVVRYKVIVFSVSGALAAVAASLFAHYQAFINPFSFTLERSIFLVALVVLGGTANLLGTLVGAVLFVGLPEVLRFLQAPQDIVDALRDFVFGALLVAFMRFRPQGLVPERAGARPRRADGTAAGAARGAAVAVDVAPAARAAAAGPALVAEGLSKRFGGIYAADGLSLVLPAGQVTALVGPNGAGKTTVFNLLTGFVGPDAGRVLLHDRDITGLAPWRTAGYGLARTFQDVRLFEHMTVLDNVMAAIPGQPGERLAPLFFAPWRTARAERDHRARALEDLAFVGLADRAGEFAGALAYGDQKLVALARLLATGADVLLLDEPASGVDVHWVSRILELIRRVAAAGKTVCIVEHNLEVVTAVADRAYFMETGRIIAEGPPEALMADPRLGEIYFGARAA